jgi:ATPase subunit of ABC transporter with duplicated ATPase domains
MTPTPQLTARQLDLRTPTGRWLFRDLHLSLEHGDRVAIVGRNGTGKTTLLDALAERISVERGRVSCSGTRVLVPQLHLGAQDAVHSQQPSPLSPGQLRRDALERAFAAEPNFLLLDEPTLDLDDAAVEWLIGAVRRFAGGCLVASHDRRLLRLFDDFFVVSESGCEHHHGSLASLLDSLAATRTSHELRYTRELARQAEREAEHVRLARKQERRKNVGRIREIERKPAKILLNAKKSAAQVNRAKLAEIQQDRLNAARDLVKSVRRSLLVQLPLDVNLNHSLPPPGPAIIHARGVPATRDDAVSDQRLDLDINRDRHAIVGPNGCGKSTLLRRLLAQEAFPSGSAYADHSRIGYIAQNAENWMKPQCLLEELCFTREDLSKAASLVAAHRFPVALAARSFDTLSPGERVRAALIALSERKPTVELLVLDEPTNHLDLLATAELERILRAWPGGLLIVSHDHEFLRNVGVRQLLSHDGTRWDHESLAQRPEYAPAELASPPRRKAG